ncbi:unnamed protein product, partial [Ostreobium quekettii]
VFSSNVISHAVKCVNARVAGIDKLLLGRSDFVTAFKEIVLEKLGLKQGTADVVVRDIRDGSIEVSYKVVLRNNVDKDDIKEFWDAATEDVPSLFEDEPEFSQYQAEHIRGPRFDERVELDAALSEDLLAVDGSSNVPYLGTRTMKYAGNAAISCMMAFTVAMFFSVARKMMPCAKWIKEHIKRRKSRPLEKWIKEHRKRAKSRQQGRASGHLLTVDISEMLRRILEREVGSKHLLECLPEELHHEPMDVIVEDMKATYMDGKLMHFGAQNHTGKDLEVQEVLLLRPPCVREGKEPEKVEVLLSEPKGNWESLKLAMVYKDGVGKQVDVSQINKSRLKFASEGGVGTGYLHTIGMESALGTFASGFAPFLILPETAAAEVNSLFKRTVECLWNKTLADKSADDFEGSTPELIFEAVESAAWIQFFKPFALDMHFLLAPDASELLNIMQTEGSKRDTYLEVLLHVASFLEVCSALETEQYLLSRLKDAGIELTNQGSETSAGNIFPWPPEPYPCSVFAQLWGSQHGVQVPLPLQKVTGDHEFGKNGHAILPSTDRTCPQQDWQVPADAPHRSAPASVPRVRDSVMEHPYWQQEAFFDVYLARGESDLAGVVGQCERSGGTCAASISHFGLALVNGLWEDTGVEGTTVDSFTAGHFRGLHEHRGCHCEHLMQGINGNCAGPYSAS